MNTCAHHADPATCTWCAAARARQRMNDNRAAANTRPVEATQHHQVTTFQVAPDHWVVARRAFWAGWEAVEVTPQLTVITHHRSDRRDHAEVVAAAVAATRTHNPETRKATR